VSILRIAAPARRSGIAVPLHDPKRWQSEPESIMGLRLGLPPYFFHNPPFKALVDGSGSDGPQAIVLVRNQEVGGSIPPRPTEMVASIST